MNKTECAILGNLPFIFTGCWEKHGEGELIRDEATRNMFWRYKVNHFSWWAAGRVNPRTSCVTVKTCYDKDCYLAAPDTLVMYEIFAHRTKVLRFVTSTPCRNSLQWVYLLL